MTGDDKRICPGKSGILIAVILAIELIAGWQALKKAEAYGLRLLEDDINITFDRGKHEIVCGFALFDRTVKALAGSPWVEPVLLDRSSENTERAYSALRRYCEATDASVCYLMDEHGVVVSSTNRGQADSFEGNNYGFRPYFKNALDGRPGFYLALGVTSRLRGYYASYPVLSDAGKPVGVVVMKKNVPTLERRSIGRFPFFIVDADDVVLLSSMPGTADRQLELESVAGSGGEVVYGGKRYLIRRRPSFMHTWTALVLAPADRLFLYRMSALAGTGVVLLLTIVFVSLFCLRGMRLKLISAQEARLRAAAQFEQVAISLAEKELLLKEIHHRVKNNLQIISSLLSLQSRHSDNEQVRAILNESQMRVYSMAAIHEHLYRNERLGGIDFGAYVRGLVERIRTVAGGAKQAKLEVDIGPCILDIDQAIPCGLIVNELVSNALKYAFPGQRRGTVRITFEHSDDRCRLCVCDDGVGMPASCHDSDKSLGLTLVRALVDQLAGTIEIKTVDGTRVCVGFVPKIYKT